LVIALALLSLDRHLLLVTEALQNRVFYPQWQFFQQETSKTLNLRKFLIMTWFSKALDSFAAIRKNQHNA
jgi:hypothetical protein